MCQLHKAVLGEGGRKEGRKGQTEGGKKETNKKGPELLLQNYLGGKNPISIMNCMKYYVESLLKIHTCYVCVCVNLDFTLMLYLQMILAWLALAPVPLLSSGVLEVSAELVDDTHQKPTGTLLADLMLSGQGTLGSVLPEILIVESTF